jgi:hypothetical protein
MAFGEIKKLVTFKPSDIEMEANDEKIAIFFPGSLPALDVFKIAVLNREFKKAIEGFFAPLKISDLKMYHDTIKFSRIMASEPDFSKYE